MQINFEFFVPGRKPGILRTYHIYIYKYICSLLQIVRPSSVSISNGTLLPSKLHQVVSSLTVRVVTSQCTSISIFFDHISSTTADD
jgi:hypothetical protein